MMKKLFIVTLLLMGALSRAEAQKERSSIRSGNKQYEKGNYVESEVDYLRAMELAPESLEARFNLGGAVYKQERYDDASKLYQSLAQDTLVTEHKSEIFYNLGNTFMKQRKFQEAVDAYKNSLRVDPSDREAKFNLAYAQKMLEKENQDNQDNQQNQNQNQNKNDQNKDQNQNDQNKDQNKDQNQNDQNKDQDQNDQNKDQSQDKDQDNKDQNQDNREQNQDQDRQGQGNQPDQMTRDEAEKLLQAIQNNEDNTRKKVDEKKAKAVGVRSGKNW